MSADQYDPTPTTPFVHDPMRRAIPLALVGLCLLCVIISLSALLAAFWVRAAGPNSPQQNEAAAFPRGKYTASALLRVAAAEDHLVFPRPEADQGRFDLYKETQRQLLKSPFVLIAALRKQEVSGLDSVRDSEDPVRWLQELVVVDFPGDAEIMRVSISGNDPREAATLVNAVVDAYLSEVVEAECNKSRERFLKVCQIYADKNEEVRTKRVRLRDLADTLGTGGVAGLALKQQMALEEYSETRRELVRVRTDLKHTQNELKMQQATLTASDALEISDFEVDEFARTDAVVGQLLQELIIQYRKHLSDLEVLADRSDDKQRAEKLKQNLQAIRSEIDARREELREELRRRKYAQTRAEIKRLSTQVGVVSDLADQLEQETAKQREQVEQLSRSSIDLEMMRNEIQQLQAVLSAIGVEQEKLNVEIGAAPRVTLIQPAFLPESRND